MYAHTSQDQESLYMAESLRLEAVTTCVGFSDLLDVTLERNHPHLDTMIVVTSHEDQRTQAVCRKHGTMLVVTDLFGKNGRSFNKGAAINAGMHRFQFHGWRMHLDSDIALPDNFRRLLFNFSHLEQDCLYGADRVDVVGPAAITRLRTSSARQHSSGCFLSDRPEHGPCARYLDGLSGYVPLGYFQLWHARSQQPYPYSLGTAAHDDVMFSMQWPESRRRLLPAAICHHLCLTPPKLGEHWDGARRPSPLK